MAQAASDRLPALGVGVTYSSAIEPVLERWPALVDVVEVEPQTTWTQLRDPAQPYRVSELVLNHLAQLPGRKLVHSVGVPVGGTVRPEPAQLKLLSRTVARLGAPWFSEHLSFNQAEGFFTGFFLPPRQTAEGVQTAARAIRDLQAALPVPIAVETGVNYLHPRPDEMPDGAFVASVIEAADCGILLDLHNIFCNAVNGRQSIDAFLASIPLDCVWEIHLAGGFELEGYWLDAHSGALPDALYDIARTVIPQLPNLKAIIFEMLPSFLPIVGYETVHRELERLHELWALRQAPRGDGPVVRSNPHPYHHRDGEGRSLSVPEWGVGDDLVNVADPYPTSLPKEERAGSGAPSLVLHSSPAAWERALGALVVGRAAEGGLVRELAGDPAIRLVNRLISEFRASMVVGVLRLTSRYLMLTLGPDVFRAILQNFWATTPPHQYAATEAEGFADYLTMLDLKVPHLAKTLAFERIALATLVDGQARIVSFDFDPLPLFRALAEGRLPTEPLTPGDFEIEVTPDPPQTTSTSGSEATRQIFPFH